MTGGQHREHLQLVEETLASLLAYLPRLRQGVVETADDLHGDPTRTADAFRRMQLVADGLSWVIEALTAIRTLLGSTFESWAEFRLDDSLQSFKVVTEYVTGSLESGDRDSCADILANELAPLLEEWESPVSALYGRVVEERSHSNGHEHAH